MCTRVCRIGTSSVNTLNQSRNGGLVYKCMLYRMATTPFLNNSHMDVWFFAYDYGACEAFDGSRLEFNKLPKYSCYKYENNRTL